MSRFSGPQYKGASRDAREARRAEAQKRATSERYVNSRLGRKARAGELDPTLYARFDGYRLAVAR